MKKKILFVIESLNIGGAEKSLVTLLNLLDYEKYDVDLQLFSYNGQFQKLLPNEVNLLSILPFFEYCSVPYKNIIKKLKDIAHFKSQVTYSLRLRSRSYTNIEKSVIMWKSVHNSFNISSKEYDIAIAYAQGVPTFYVADKIKAKKKIAWINVTYLPKDEYLKYIADYYNKFDIINAVSESVYKQIIKTFGFEERKCVIINDILDFSFNKKMALLEAYPVIPKIKNQINLLTVGRLVNQKGYDIAIEACKILKERNINFKWYIIGEGNQRAFLENKIIEYHLEDIFILLGSKNNPYPYFEACDIYVQTSKFEGFGITLAEARMFNKPIVTTEFDAVYSQMIHDINGLVVSIDANSVANGIEQLINDESLRRKYVKNLKKEKKGNLEEIDKFYYLIEN